MAAPEDQAVLIVLHAAFHGGAQVAGDGRVGIGVVKVDGDDIARGAGVPVIHGIGEGFAAARARRVIIQHIGVFAAGPQVERAVFATGHQSAVALRVSPPCAGGHATERIHQHGVAIGIRKGEPVGDSAAVAPGIQREPPGRGRGILVMHHKVDTHGFRAFQPELVRDGYLEFLGLAPCSGGIGVEGIGVCARSVDVEDAIRAVDREAALIVSRGRDAVEGDIAQAHIVMPVLIRIEVRISDGEAAGEAPVGTQGIQLAREVAGDFRRVVGIAQVNGDGAGGRAEEAVPHGIGEGLRGADAAGRGVCKHIAVAEAGAVPFIEVEVAMFAAHDVGAGSGFILAPLARALNAAGRGQAHMVAIRVRQGGSAGGGAIGIAQGIHARTHSVRHRVGIDVVGNCCRLYAPYPMQT